METGQPDGSGFDARFVNLMVAMVVVQVVLLIAILVGATATPV